ncbi:hypothetical protein HD554DRAFT_766247 [Boletus coccyginus]|nr:hypothetical protein HD554DRAFT_766247 [Boletus coccyginus]
MDAREDLPKVSIETEQDWRRIQQNLSAAFLARLDTELESHGQAGDREALLPHVHQFLDTIFDIARPNLRINGRTSSADEPCSDEDDVEPFDEALDRHIWSLSDQRLKWDKEIADRRRSRPQDVEKLVTESLAQHHACDVEMLDESEARVDVSVKQVDSELQHMLLNAVSLAPQLLQTIKSQRGRADRIKSVSAEVKALKP